MMSNVWIFQGNPDRFDFDAYLQASENIVWSVNQKHLAPRMGIGDIVYLWRSGGKKRGESGVIAQARMIDVPSERDEDHVALPFWRSTAKSERQLRVGLHLEHVANKKEIIDRNWLEEDPILCDLPILKMPQGTNYLIPQSQCARLKTLWDRTGVDWTRDESIVGLWTYNQLIGKSISKTKDSLIAKSAILVGRAVTGMYSKVQNFVSLDPRVDRKGLDAVSEMDRKVWSEFYSPETSQLKLEQLNDEFELKWGGIHEEVEPGPSELAVARISTPITNPSRPARLNKTLSGGQGYIRDARIRRAIELRAVEMATEHFLKSGYEVTDTGSTESFDLSCIKDGKERRVEVKGTTTNGTTVILTRAEVEHARTGLVPVDLVIVRDLEILRSPEGPQAIGGVFSVLENWCPAEDDLSIATYNYKVRGC